MIKLYNTSIQYKLVWKTFLCKKHFFERKSYISEVMLIDEKFIRAFIMYLWKTYLYTEMEVLV